MSGALWFLSKKLFAGLKALMIKSLSCGFVQTMCAVCFRAGIVVVTTLHVKHNAILW